MWRTGAAPIRLFLFLLAVFAGASAASAPFDAPAFAAFSERVSNFTLSNGLKVILLENYKAPRRSKIAAFFGQVEYYGLCLGYPERYSGPIDGVTGEDVLRPARTYLHPDAFVTVKVADLKAAGFDAKENGPP
jgi:predicted Zn-dependent peptidase